MHHAYRDGYSVLPRLRKLDGPIFIRDAEYDRFIAEKARAASLQACFVEHAMTDALYELLRDFLATNYPGAFEGRVTSGGAPRERFDRLAMRIQEDVAVHRLDDETDWLACAHVCLPSGWLPEEKVGRPLAAIHDPVPGMNLDNSRKLVEAMVFAGPFERYVWNVVFEDRINGHPRIPKARFDPAAPKLWVKVERQVTVGFPEHRAAAFVLRQHLIPDPEIDRPALVAALCEMTPAQRAYKGIDGCIDELLDYLSS